MWENNQDVRLSQKSEYKSIHAQYKIIYKKNLYPQIEEKQKEIHQTIKHAIFQRWNYK